MIFVDTGAFLARYLPRDNHHLRATRSWKALGVRDWKCYTSSFVLDETFTLLARRSSYAFAAGRARSIYASKALQILRPTADDEHQALALFEKYADQEVSFTDCISFALMKRQHIPRFFFRPPLQGCRIRGVARLRRRSTTDARLPRPLRFSRHLQDLLRCCSRSQWHPLHHGPASPLVPTRVIPRHERDRAESRVPNRVGSRTRARR